MKKAILYSSTILKLGIKNVLYIIWYRLTLKIGLRKRWFPITTISFKDVFFNPSKIRQDYPEEWKTPLLDSANKILNGKLEYYSFHWKTIDRPPNWFINPFNSKTYPNNHLHWTCLPDFHPEVGEIKNIWEASRFNWITTLARANAVTGESKYLIAINSWLKDWIEKNPVNNGPNWKCGQEASIRIFNLLNAAFILSQHNNPSQTLIDYIFLSLKRISNNIGYAIAQDNNHGTSEAAGLFIGGFWLYKLESKNSLEAYKFYTKGKRILENRIRKLVAKDGSFSQHSINYHRVFLDTVSFVEFWRKQLGAPNLSPSSYTRLKAANNWLYQLVDEISGDAPNLGANDGALLLKTNSCKFRDFRPSLQLSSQLLNGYSLYKAGAWNESCYWFAINAEANEKTKEIKSRRNSILDKAYITLLAKDSHSWALLRAPNFKFRPSHNDVFHFDLWLNGRNIIHDAGTFSYNPPENTVKKPLKSVTFHNTVSFDDHEQMPSISRFLLSNWIKPNEISEIYENGSEVKWQGSYFDSKKNKHRREIKSIENKWIVEDSFSGSFKKAIVRFNLINDTYSIQKNRISFPWGYILVEFADSFKVIDSVHSPHYFQLEKCNQLEIKANKNHNLKTTIVLGA